MLLLFIFWVNPCLAQDKLSNEYYPELLKNYRIYQSLIEPFNTQKSRFLAYQSVSAQADFLDASKNLVAAEVEAINSYTSFIRTYLAEATRVINYKENYFYVMLDEELHYLSSAKNKIGLVSSLSDTQTFLKELSLHYRKISQISYQIKSMVEIGSANKTLENIKVETGKLESLLNEKKEEQARDFAAKEKFSGLKKELIAAENLLVDADRALKNAPKDGSFAPVSVQVRKLINQSSEKFDFIVSGYKNIVLSLK